MDLKTSTTRARKKLLSGVAAWLGFEPRKCLPVTVMTRSLIERQLLGRSFARA